MRLLPGQYYGAILKKHEAVGLRMLEAEYKPYVKLPRHSHASARFSVLLQGTITETHAKKSLEWKPLSFGFNLAEEEHTTSVHGMGARFLIIEVTPEWLERASGCSTIFDGSTVIQGGMLTWLGSRLHKEVLRPDEISPLAIEGIVLEMMAETSREHTKRLGESQLPRWLERARELIEARFAESLSLASIAESVEVHPVHLARTFRRNYGRTIGDYVRSLRVQFVCEQLSASEATFSEIAQAAGFSDQAHLSRTFKQFTGMTPAQFRTNSNLR
jgi:AraC family transcriptional regulator